jgi:hypothetical protein
MKREYVKLLRLTFVSIVVVAFLADAALLALAQTKQRPRVKYYSVKADKKIRVRMNETISSESARVGDTFTTTVVDPVYAAGGVEVIPAGSIINGRVSNVAKAQKKGKPGTIDVVFNQAQLPNGRKRAIDGSLTSLDEGGTESDDEGRASGKKTSNRSVKFIGGGAGGGALIGAIAGGGKGALIGGAIGAGAGVLGNRLTKGKEAEVKEGAEFGVIINRAFSLPAFRASN